MLSRSTSIPPGCRPPAGIRPTPAAGSGADSTPSPPPRQAFNPFGAPSAAASRQPPPPICPSNSCDFTVISELFLSIAIDCTRLRSIAVDRGTRGGKMPPRMRPLPSPFPPSGRGVARSAGGRTRRDWFGSLVVWWLALPRRPCSNPILSPQSQRIWPPGLMPLPCRGASGSLAIRVRLRPARSRAPLRSPFPPYGRRMATNSPLWEWVRKCSRRTDGVPCTVSSNFLVSSRARKRERSGPSSSSTSSRSLRMRWVDS